MSPFIAGVLVGAFFIGAPLGLFVGALCSMASRADER